MDIEQLDWAHSWADQEQEKRSEVTREAARRYIKARNEGETTEMQSLLHVFVYLALVHHPKANLGPVEVAGISESEHLAEAEMQFLLATGEALPQELTESPLAWRTETRRAALLAGEFLNQGRIVHNSDESVSISAQNN